MKILVVRFSSIGDIVLTTPVLRCLHDQVPGAEIHYLTKQSFVGLLEHNPNVHKVWGLQSSFKELMQQLKTEQFDFIVDLHNNLRSKRVSFALRVPYKRVDKLNWAKWKLVKLKMGVMPDVHIVDRYLAVAKRFNIINDGKGLDYFIPSETVKPNNLPYRFVCYAIGGQHATKKLPVEKIIELAQMIEGDLVLIGGKEDMEVGRHVSARCSNVIDLCGALSINQSALVMQHANTVITHDTGMMHIASALKKKVVSIWGNTIPEFGMYPYKPESSSQQFEVEDLGCRPCSKIGFDVCPKGHFNCMNQQNLSEIAKASNR